VRDWLYVEDHCRALEQVVLEGRVGETYNIGGRSERANLDLVHLLCGLIDEAFARESELRTRFPRSPAARGGKSAELITLVKDRPGHDRRYAIDTGKIERELGFCPEESFESGIRKTVDWYLSHEEWWRSVMDGRYQAWTARQYGER